MSSIRCKVYFQFGVSTSSSFVLSDNDSQSHYLLTEESSERVELLSVSWASVCIHLSRNMLVSGSDDQTVRHHKPHLVKFSDSTVCGKFNSIFHEFDTLLIPRFAFGTWLLAIFKSLIWESVVHDCTLRAPQSYHLVLFAAFMCSPSITDLGFCVLDGHHQFGA